MKQTATKRIQLKRTCETCGRELRKPGTTKCVYCRPRNCEICHAALPNGNKWGGYFEDCKKLMRDITEATRDRPNPSISRLYTRVVKTPNF